MGKIIVSIRNGSGYILKKRTIRIRGGFRFQLLAASKVLAILSGVREIHNGTLEATVELVDLGKATQFEGLVKRYSPIPVTIIYKREVIDEVV